MLCRFRPARFSLQLRGKRRAWGRRLAALLCYENTHRSARRERRKPVPAVGEANQCSRVRPVVFHFAVLDGRKHSHKPAAARARD